MPDAGFCSRRTLYGYMVIHVKSPVYIRCVVLPFVTIFLRVLRWPCVFVCNAVWCLGNLTADKISVSYMVMFL